MKRTINQLLPHRVGFFEDPRFRRARMTFVGLFGMTVLVFVGIAIMLLREAKLSSEGDLTEIEPARVDLPESPHKVIETAIHLSQAGNLAGAKKVLLRVDLEKANSAEGWELAGALMAAEGRTEAALSLYDKAIAIRPSSSLYYRRAHLLREHGDFDLALKSMELALALAPGDVFLSNERLLLLVQSGRKEIANDLIQALREQGSPGSSSPWILGLCGVALENGEFSEAKKTLSAGQAALAPEVFNQLLSNPVIVRHVSRPEISPFYFRNQPR